MKRHYLYLLVSLSVVNALPADAAGRESVYSPRQNVLCDRYMCTDRNGVSKILTEKYLGKKPAVKLFSQGDFDKTEFTFANGIFCDTKERLCRKDRYFDANGKRSSISKKYTRMLFGM